jgi:cell shape-determining protein MreC
MVFTIPAWVIEFLMFAGAFWLLSKIWKRTDGNTIEKIAKFLLAPLLYVFDLIEMFVFSPEFVQTRKTNEKLDELIEENKKLRALLTEKSSKNEK